jgi:hypothetical protein
LYQATIILGSTLEHKWQGAQPQASGSGARLKELTKKLATRNSPSTVYGFSLLSSSKAGRLGSLLDALLLFSTLLLPTVYAGAAQR